MGDQRIATMNAGDLAALRICERAGCGYTIPNGITDLGQILLAMQNHAMIGHPASGSSEGGGGAKSNAPIPQLEEQITEVQWTAWKNRFERW